MTRSSVSAAGLTLSNQGGNGAPPIQRGTFTCPDGQVLRVVVNDERGATTPDGVFRVYAGLRSDPFILAWLLESLKPFPNLLQHDNVLSIVVEFDTAACSTPSKGSLFGVIAETTPLPQPEQPRRTRAPTFRLDRQAGTDQHAAQQCQHGRDGGLARPLESANAVRDCRRASPAVPQAPDRQPDQLGHARRPRGLDACRAGRQRKRLPR